MAQIARREDLVLAFEKYQVNGEEKTNWKNIGEIITFKNEDGTYSKIVKLWNLPGQTVRVFNREEKPKPTPVAPVEPEEPGIDLQDIPF